MLQAASACLNRFTSTRLALCLAFYSSFVCASIAQAEIAVIVNPRNTSAWDADSLVQIREIFLSKKQRFPNGLVAKPVDQQPGAIRAEFYQKVAQKDESALSVYWSNLIFSGDGQPPKVIGDDNAVKNRVKENINAIGYITSKSADESIKVIYIVK